MRSCMGDNEPRRYGWQLPVILIAAALAATSCGLLNGGGDEPPVTANSHNLEKPTIRVGVMQVGDTAPFYLAMSKGYFKDEGLTVQITPTKSGTDSMPLLAGDHIDIGFGNWATLFQAQVNKAGDYRILADGAQGASHVMIVAVRPDSGIHGPKDLAGKTISTNAPNDVPSLALKAVLQANGVDPASVKMAVVHHADTTAALAGKEIDAAIQLEPYITVAHQQLGTEAAIDLFGPGPMENLPIAGYFSLVKFVQQNPKTAAAFQRALERGAAEAQNAKEVRQILPTYAAGIDKATADLVTMPTFPTSLSSVRLQRVADLMLTYGQLPTKLDVTPLIFKPAV